MAEKRKTIDLNTKYNLPNEYQIIDFKGKILIIAPECFNYIVLSNEIQKEIYLSLYNSTITEIVGKWYNKEITGFLLLLHKQSCTLIIRGTIS